MDVDAAPGAGVELLVVEDLELRGLFLEIGIEFVEFVDFCGVGVFVAAVLRVGFERHVVPLCGPECADGRGLVDCG